jgi:acetyl-CoA C-acetyltransferase
MAQAFIFDAIRTPRGRGKAGGGLYEVKPVDMVKNLLDAMQTRNKLDPSAVEDMILATGEPVNEQGQNIAKTALIYAGWSQVTTGAQLHRYCAGALDAVNNGAAKVRAGFEDLVLAGGVESMSRLGIGASGAAAGDPWVAMHSYGVSQGIGRRFNRYARRFEPRRHRPLRFDVTTARQQSVEKGYFKNPSCQ